VVASSFDDGKASHLCERLLTNGAKVTVNSNAGHAPLDVMIHEKRIETTSLLRKHGGKATGKIECEGK